MSSIETSLVSLPFLLLLLLTTSDLKVPLHHGPLLELFPIPYLSEVSVCPLGFSRGMGPLL